MLSTLHTFLQAERIETTNPPQFFIIDMASDDDDEDYDDY